MIVQATFSLKISLYFLFGSLFFIIILFKVWEAQEKVITCYIKMTHAGSKNSDVQPRMCKNECTTFTYVKENKICFL